MKRVIDLTILIVIIFATSATAQSEASLIKTNEEGISIKRMNVETKIIGDIGITTYTIEVYNNLDRDLSGELQFPLSDHQTVIGYSLDIKGELRDAVGVDKAKGRTAYESIVSKNIDPALVEKTEGNNFKTRIYPIPANGSRIIVLEIVDNLVWKNGTFEFILPVNFKEKINKKEISIDFIGFSEGLEISDYESFELKKGNQFTSLTSDRAEDVHIKVTPKKQSFAFYQEYEEEYFYYTSTLLPDTDISKKTPKTINIFWDCSRSRKGVIAKEIKFLREFCKRVKQVELNIISFNTEIIDKKVIKVRNGNTKKVEKYISMLSYDGATQYGCIKEMPIADLNLLFSDGLGNFGNTNFVQCTIPTYTITSQATINPSKLIGIARDHAGVFINLENQSLLLSIDQIIKESTVFSGYKEKGIKACYPTVNTKLVDQQFTSVARGVKVDALTLDFKDVNDLDISLVPIEIKQGLFDLRKFFVTKQIKELSIEPEENKEALLRLGLSYNLLTDYTSLIVLETLEDYINNEIVPPNEDWKKIYHDNMTLARLEREMDRMGSLYHQVSDLGYLLSWMYPEKEDDIDDEIEKLEEVYDDREEVLDDKYEQIKDYLDSIQELNIPKPLAVIIDKNYTEPSPLDAKAKITVIKEGDFYLVTGVISEGGMPIPGFSIHIKGTNMGTSSDFDGIFSLKVPPNSLLGYSFVGYEQTVKEVVLGSQEITIKNSMDQLDEIVMIGYRSKASKYKDVTDFLINSPNIDEYQIFKFKEKMVVKKKENHIVLGKNPLLFEDYESSDLQELDWEDGEDELKYLDWEDVFSLEIIPPLVAIKLAGELGKDGIIFAYTKDYVEDDKIVIPIMYNKHILHNLSKKVWSDMPASLKKIRMYPPQKRYKKYLEITEKEKQTAGFYMVAGNLFAEDAIDISMLIWSNIAEIQLDNHENIRTLAYLLRSIGKYEEAIPFFEKIMAIRPDEPIAHRDLAITYALANNKEKAVTILEKALQGSWMELNRDPGDYDEVMNTVYNDYQKLLKKDSLHTDYKGLKEFVVTADLRVVLTWTSSNTDVDLHLVTPSGEDFYYGNDESDTIRYNTDMTDGFGPEEILVKTAEKGTYTVLVDFFADRQQTIHGPVGLSIEMYKYFGTDREERTEKVLTLTKEADNILGATITF